MKTIEISDQALVELVIAGQHDAFETVVTRYYETVRLVALAKSGNRADAEDVAQETFLKAYETLGVLRDRNKLAPWLVAVARNRAISVVRMRERERQIQIQTDESCVAPDPTQQECFDAVLRQVKALPENLREVVLLHYFEGLKCREIGDRLDMNTNAVVKRLSRARTLLGDRLLREWGHGARTTDTRPRIHQIMGTIAALPVPDWKAQGAQGAHVTIPKNSSGNAPFTGMARLEWSMALAALLLVGYYTYHHLFKADPALTLPLAEQQASTPAIPDERMPDRVPSIAAGRPARGNPFDGPVRIPIEAPPPRTEVGYLAGTVVDQEGAPVGDARVMASSKDTSGHHTTDPNGTFRINVTAPVPTAKAGKVQRELNIHCDKADFVSAELPNVPLGTTGIEIVLLRPAAVFGRVIDAATGKPIPNFSLAVQRPMATALSKGTFNSRTGVQAFHTPDGTFQLDDTYGIESLRVAAEGYTGQRVELDVRPGEAEGGLVVALEPAGVIHGLVYDGKTRAPVADATLQIPIHTALPRTAYQYTTDRDGKFTIAEVPADGSLSFTAHAKGYAMAYLAGVTARPGQTIQVPLDAGATLRGTVVYNGTVPPPAGDGTHGYVTLSLQSHDGAPVANLGGGKGDIRADGTYEIPNLTDGIYSAYAWVHAPDGRGQMSAYQIVSVQGGNVATHHFDLAEHGGDIRVAVAGLSDATAVRLELWTGGSAPTLFFTPENNPWHANDGFRFPTMEPGTYRVRGTLPGADEEVLEQDLELRNGQTIDVLLDFSGLASEPEGEDSNESP